MQLQTKIPLEKQSNNLIDYHANVLLLGSCFSDNIGGKLDYFKFQNVQNPFGILFHPKATTDLIGLGLILLGMGVHYRGKRLTKNRGTPIEATES